jgi:acyl-CoA thioesterase I
MRSPLVRRLRPGLATTLDAVAPFRTAWGTANAKAREGGGPLWLVLGDSTAQGIGAPGPDRGYVGQLRVLLEARDGHPWRVLNASRSGARVRDVLNRQLRWLDELDQRPDLVTCAAGANDIAWRPGSRRVTRDLRVLLERLPRGAVMATLPNGLGVRRTLALNDLVRAEAPRRGLRVADVWAHTGPPWAGNLAPDHFHPNEQGYRRWTTAFAEALGINAASPPTDPRAAT